MTQPRKPKITSRQEGGDDGYQYVIRINGKSFVSGLHRTELAYYKIRAREAFYAAPHKW